MGWINNVVCPRCGQEGTRKKRHSSLVRMEDTVRTDDEGRPILKKVLV